MMRLSDIVGKMGTTFYIEVALVLFFAVFVGVMVYAFGMLRNDAVERFASMPLEDAETSLTTASQRSET